MKNVDTNLLEDKMDEAVTHYINSHQAGESVHVDGGSMSLNVEDEAGRVVTVLQGQGFSSQMNRHLVSEHTENGPWNEDLLDPEMRLAALVAHLAHQSRASHHQSTSHSHSTKISSLRDVDSSVILDASLKLFSGHSMDAHSDSIVVEVPATLPPLPPLQGICSRKNQETDWYHNKNKASLKENSEILTEPESSMIELTAGASPAQIKQQNKKSLPHKKRISRKLKRNTGNSTPQQDIVVLNCNDVQHEEILPDNFVTGVQHQEHLSEETHHITHEVRPILICQLCGEFYGEEQIKFYQHLKQHYEPHATIIIENPVSDISIDKMTNTCIVDTSATLPDSIVELSLENTVPKTLYPPSDKHILYTSSDRAMYTNRLQYSMASMDKEPVVPTSEADKTDIYDTLDKFEMYSCTKCNKQFRKQKHCEAHIKEAHSNPKLEDMGEFSEPEDLMEGIHVAVEEGTEQYEQTLLPHLTVENGQVHQEHVRHWYLRAGGGGGPGALAACGVDGAYCPVCPPPAAPPPAPHPPPPPTAPHPPPPAPPAPHAPSAHTRHQAAMDAQTQLKEEVLQRILESEVPNEHTDHFSDNIIHEQEIPAEPEPLETQEIKTEHSDGKKRSKKCECVQCGRVFFHRNSLLYHTLSHRGKQHECLVCGKGFYTSNALKVHVRVHNGDRPYKCEECGRDFRQWSDLKYHKVSLHSTQKHFKCEFCGKEFARKYSLNVHRRIHTGEKNYKCDYCNKTFRASSYRLAHMRTHTGDRPYKCTTCDKGFRVAGDLRRHMLTHERARARPDRADRTDRADRADDPHKPNDKNKKIPPKDPKDSKEDLVTTKVKKIALASTARPPLVKSEKKPKPKKVQKKEGAPNVTVVQTPQREQFKTDPVEYDQPFDTRQEYGKVKEVYSESHPQYAKEHKSKEYGEQIYSYKDNEPDRDLATLKPLYRSNMAMEAEKPVYSRSENTDGKMQVFTHVEKSYSIADIRGIVKDREMQGDSIETGFLDNLTALYNIPAV